MERTSDYLITDNITEIHSVKNWIASGVEEALRIAAQMGIRARLTTHNYGTDEGETPSLVLHHPLGSDIMSFWKTLEAEVPDYRK